MGAILQSDALNGASVFVAGGTSGINLEIARAFAAQGARVAVASRKKDKVDAAVEMLEAFGGRALGYVIDVRNYDEVRSALASAHGAFGDFDVVVSGAAGNFIAPALGLSANAFKTVVDIDLLGTFNVFRACFDLVRKPGASLIAITAPQGKRPMMAQAHACAAKAGVNMLVECLAMEWGPAGVRVNAISPGPINGTEGMARLSPDPADVAKVKQRLAMREYGEPSDIADLALFLASENARFMTGAIINCDGGSTLGDATGDMLSVSPREARR